MNTPEERRAEAERLMREAEAALADQRPSDAMRLLGEAKAAGASAAQVNRLSRAARSLGQREQVERRGSVRLGMVVAVLGYLVLSVAQPATWTVPVWACLALVVVPLVAGYATGRRQGHEQTVGRRFAAGAIAAGLPILVYTAIWLAVDRSRISSGGSPGAVFVVCLFVTAVYTLAAAVVAGVASGWLAWRGRHGGAQ